MTGFTDKLLVVLPRLSPYMNSNLRLSKAYVNLVGFFQGRYRMETHVISSAESYIVVPKLKDVKAVLAIHPADVVFVNNYAMLLNADDQNITYQNAFAAAEAKMPLKRGLNTEDRFAAISAREKAAVKYIAQTHYDVVVDFENPWNSSYNLKPKIATIFLKVSTLNHTVKGFLSGKPFNDICSLLAYDGARRPLGSWKNEPDV